MPPRSNLHISCRITATWRVKISRQKHSQHRLKTCFSSMLHKVRHRYIQPIGVTNFKGFPILEFHGQNELILRMNLIRQGTWTFNPSSRAFHPFPNLWYSGTANSKKSWLHWIFHLKKKIKNLIQ